MNYIHLEANMVPPALRGGYAGKKFKAVVTEQVTVPADAGIWSGGSRDYWKGVNLATGEVAGLPNQESSPWNANRYERVIALRPGFAVVRSTMFQGRDLGLTFYIHPDNAAAMFPAPAVELTCDERLVLLATRMFKSSYGGQDRYQMAERDYACKALLDGAAYPTRAAWDAAKASLIERKLLNKAGAITPAGRNAT
jgi:hypothetical protein